MSAASPPGGNGLSSTGAGGGDVRSPDLVHRPNSSASHQGNPSGQSDTRTQGQGYPGGGPSSNQPSHVSQPTSNPSHQLAPPGQASVPQTSHGQRQGGSPIFHDQQSQQQQQSSAPNGQQSYASHLFHQQQRQAQDQHHQHGAFPAQPSSAHPSHTNPPSLAISVPQSNTPQPDTHLSASNVSSNHQQEGSPSASSPAAAMTSMSSPSTSSFPPGSGSLQPQNNARSPPSDPPAFSPMPGFPAVASLGGYPTGDGSNNAPSMLSPATPNADGDQARDRTRTASSTGAGASLGAGREAGEKRTLWLGDLESWMDEAYLRSMASLMGWDIVAIKLIRPAPQQNPNPNAVVANGYCFLTFPTAHLASRILHTLTPTPTNPPIMMPNSQRPFKANWASSSTSSTNPAAVNPAQMTDIPPEREYSIFVGDLAPEVGEGDLVSLFLNPPTRSEAEGGPRKPFTSTRSAKIMLDPGGGGSRGYGFVRFGEEADQLRALAEMQGVYCLSRPMRLSHATAKNKSGISVGGSQGGSVAGSSRGGTPIPPTASGHDALPSPSHLGSFQQQQQQQHVASPLQQQAYNPYDGLSPNSQQASNAPSAAGVSPTSYDRSPGSNNFPLVNAAGQVDQQRNQQQQQQSQPQQQSSVNPLPPPQRRLSPNTIEYLTQLAAANGGTLPFGPGMTFPPMPVASSAGPPAAGEATDAYPSSASVPSLSIPDGRDGRPFQNPNQSNQRSRSPSSGISPSSSPFPPSASGSSHGGGPSSGGFPTIQIPSNNQQQFQQQQQQYQQHQQQQQGHPQQMRDQRSDSMASINSPLSPTTAAAQQNAMYNEGGGNAAVNSTDPNNTTVFVGGLSSLISEETLKTFFTPFGEITYVKIPPGKGCGFVQFVRKADAERAIERMQGFPIGGGRIRLSWGRSQYKAAQAAAQAAQLGLGLGALSGINGLTPAQAAQLTLALQGLGGLGPANGNLLRQLAAATSTPGYAGRGGVNAGNAGLGGLGGLSGLGSPTGFGGLGGVGGFGGAQVTGGLGGLAGLSPQTLQGLLALQAGGLGGGAGALNPALLARLSGPGGLGGFGANDLGGQSDGQGLDGNMQGPSSHNYNPVGQSNFAPFSPAQSPIAHNSALPPSHLGQNGFSASDSRHDDYGRYDDLMHQQQQQQQQQRHQQQRDDELHDQFSAYSRGGSSAPSERDFLNGMYSSGSTAATSPTTSTRIPGSYSQSHPSAPSHLRSVTSPGSEVSSSPFDSQFRPPPLQSSASYSSDRSGQFFGGAFSPPATAPGMPGLDYLQQQQLNAPSRARAASASVHSGGNMNDLAAEMETLNVGGGRMGTGPGSGRSFGYPGSFAGATLRSQLGGSRYQGGGGGRFDEGGQ